MNRRIESLSEVFKIIVVVEVLCASCRSMFVVDMLVVVATLLLMELVTVVIFLVILPLVAAAEILV